MAALSFYCNIAPIAHILPNIPIPIYIIRDRKKMLPKILQKIFCCKLLITKSVQKKGIKIAEKSV